MLTDFEDCIEADDDYSVAQSSYQSDLASITSSIVNYEYENGRRYHGFRAGKYLMPNDEAEQDRLDLQHHFWGLALGGRFYLSPLKKENVKEILDVGTGTGIFFAECVSESFSDFLLGIWAVDIGDEFPDANVVGTDLSPIQPRWVPPNVSFEINDLEDEWNFPQKFDFIMSRALVGAIKDWNRHVANAYKSLAPGGYLEIQEYNTFEIFSDDGTYDNVNSNIAKYYQLMTKGMKMMGSYIDFEEVPGMMQRAGFTDVTVKKLKSPFSPWAKNPHKKEEGRIAYEIFSTGLEAYGVRTLTTLLGMSLEDAQSLIKKAHQEMGNLGTHGYCLGYVIYGRKP